MEWMYLSWAVAAAAACYFLGFIFKSRILHNKALGLFSPKWKKSALLFLWRAGASYKNEALLAQLVLGSILSVLLMILLPSPFNLILLLLVLLAVTLGRQRYKSRQDQVGQELISLAGTLSLAVSGGQDFAVALAFYVEQEKGLLRDECHESLSRLRLGQDRASAFDHLVQRFPITREFFSAVRLSEKQGTPLAQVLQGQAKRWREHRLHQAEAYAQRLPILLMGPLALCIFPCVFLALLGPYLIELF